jgi:uncharacterized protein YndB with AHSA1/START domain
MTETYSQIVEIKATPDTVFDHFVDPKQLVTWMGDYARLDAVQDGLFSVDINGVLIRGKYLLLERPTRIEIAWGEAGNEEMPPGSTRLCIEITATASGSKLTLSHSGLTPVEAAGHAIGWEHFLQRLSQAAAGKPPGEDPWKDAPPTM